MLGDFSIMPAAQNLLWLLLGMILLVVALR
jgi:hypothetical protein